MLRIKKGGAVLTLRKNGASQRITMDHQQMHSVLSALISALPAVTRFNLDQFILDTLLNDSSRIPPKRTLSQGQMDFIIRQPAVGKKTVNRLCGMLCNLSSLFEVLHREQTHGNTCAKNGATISRGISAILQPSKHDR